MNNTDARHHQRVDYHCSVHNVSGIPSIPLASIVRCHRHGVVQDEAQYLHQAKGLLEVQNSQLVFISERSRLVLESDVGHEGAEAGSKEACVELRGPHIEVVALPDLGLL